MCLYICVHLLYVFSVHVYLHVHVYLNKHTGAIMLDNKCKYITVHFVIGLYESQSAVQIRCLGGLLDPDGFKDAPLQRGLDHAHSLKTTPLQTLSIFQFYFSIYPTIIITITGDII